MPYVSKGIKEKLDEGFEEPAYPGELNYALTKVINQYLLNDRLNYNTISEAIGALECAKLELYRRIAVPYEDKKMKENGDVFDPSLLVS